MSKWTRPAAYVLGRTASGAFRLPPTARQMQEVSLYWDKRWAIDNARAGIAKRLGYGWRNAGKNSS